MPVVSDYTDILMHIYAGNQVMRIGDYGDNWDDPSRLGISFDTGGRNGGHSAVLFVVYRGLTERDVAVQINGQQVGTLPRLRAETANDWTTQIFTFPGGTLRGSGYNSIDVRAPFLVNPSPGDHFDDFEIKELVCFFKQSA